MNGFEVVDEAVRRAGALTDSFGRRIDHLRLSVTDACDLRCVYCRPAAMQTQSCNGLLSDAQRVDVVRVLHSRFGLSHVRLTGGEPLLYEELPSLVNSIKETCPQVRVALTTNGRLLGRCAAPLREAGVDRLNVSLDSLDAARFRGLTGGRLEYVLAGLDAARSAGFDPPKINTVVLRGFNDEEVIDLATWAIERGSEIRFLEAMPIGAAGAFNRERFVAAAEVRRRLSEAFTLTPLAYSAGATATTYRARSGSLEGVIGTIAPVTEPFCHSCRRIRLTADGRLFPCLLDSVSVDIREAWDGRFDPEQLALLLERAADSKRRSGSTQSVSMVQLGG